MIVQVAFVIETEDQKEAWIRTAILGGFARREPKLRWTERERREAIRYAIARTVQQHQPRPIGGITDGE